MNQEPKTETINFILPFFTFIVGWIFAAFCFYNSPQKAILTVHCPDGSQIDVQSINNLEIDSELYCAPEYRNVELSNKDFGKQAFIGLATTTKKGEVDEYFAPEVDIVCDKVHGCKSVK